MLVTLIIMSGFATITAIIVIGLLIESGKFKLHRYGVAENVVAANNDTQIAKAKAQTAFYQTLEARVTDAHLKDENHNVPPIDQELIKLIFGAPGQPLRGEIDGPKG